MVFSSILFLLYFLPLFLLTYYLTPRSYRNYVILAFSIFFYSWGAPKFIFALLAITAVDFAIVKAMFRQDDQRRRKLLLACSICVNLGLLFYFKYCNFFIENVNVVLSAAGATELRWTKVLLPIGISFFTFETLTYSIDAYRRVIKPLDKLTDYYVYILLFPKLIAGPIVRFNLIDEQIRLPRHETANDRLQGLIRFCIGLGKKVLLANLLGREADYVFNNNFANFDSTMAWIGLLQYTFQIYFDFSGYSDMAIGLAQMMGFSFPENFDNPYISKSITEFWRRWHITLGSWMRDYLYIPLGGNRVNNRLRLYFNLWVVFLISGLWHGPSWNYVLWGAYHGFFLILDRLFLEKLLQRCGSVIANAFTFFLVMLGWVLFRLEDLSLVPAFYRKLFCFHFTPVSFSGHPKVYIPLIVAAFFAFFAFGKRGKQLQQSVFKGEYNVLTSTVLTLCAIVLLVFSVSLITASDFNPFIYFRF